MSEVLGRTLFARQKKSGREYEITLNGQHLQVLAYLYDDAPASDWQMVRDLVGSSVQLGARRCELRDAGLVRQDGKCSTGMTWRLTAEGQEIMQEVLGHAAA